MQSGKTEAVMDMPGTYGYGQPGGNPPAGGGYGPPPGGAGYGPPQGGGGYGPPQGGGGYGPPPGGGGGGYGPPPAGHGPPQPAYSPPPSQGTSISAIFSLIFGVLSWLTCCCLSAPVAVPGLILGLIGMSATSGGQKSGRGLAITGTVLNGLAAVLSIGFFSFGGVAVYQSGEEGALQAEALIRRLQKGEADAVYQEAGLTFRDRHPQDFLRGYQAEIQGLPTLTSVKHDWQNFGEFHTSSENDLSQSTEELRVAYIATFGTIERRGVIDLKKVNKGGWVLQDFTFH